MQQFSFIICLIITLTTAMTSLNSCDQFPLSQIECINVVGVACQFNTQENVCVQTKSTNLGCDLTLNKNSCLSQLSDQYGFEVKCIFNNGCQTVTQRQIDQLGCSPLFSKYACMASQNLCFWDQLCFLYDSRIIFKCKQLYSVTPSICANTTGQKCMNSGFLGNYQCVEITNEQVTCSTLGLNEEGCINVINGRCIFINNQCLDATSLNSIECSMKYNKLGCLSIENNLQCQWKDNQCQEFDQFDQTCDNLSDVNSYVCQQYNGICTYDQQNHKCQVINEFQEIKCDQIGLSMEACISIKNQYCTFVNGYCQTITNISLVQLRCDMQLNEDACINIQTDSQYCLWDGSNCKRISLNQNVSCLDYFINSQIKVNGKFCQAITKSKEMCKYNLTSKQCVYSNDQDQCNSPFLNINGCIGILKQLTPCKWIQGECQSLTIYQHKTKCSDLGYVNPIACSLVLENNDIGCYFNQQTQQCEVIDLNSDNTLLSNIICNNLSYGINRSLCGSIKTNLIGCRWYENQCTQVENPQQISNVPCSFMQYSNARVCQLITYNNELCRYQVSELGCINNINSKEQLCDFLGLNNDACRKASGNCYFNTKTYTCQFISSDSEDSSSIFKVMVCEGSSLSKESCLSVLTIGQQCSYQNSNEMCIYQDVQLNESCLYYSQTKYVNANTCASILMSSPDCNPKGCPNMDPNQGYCSYDSSSHQCFIDITPCTTPCCTENEKIGSNAHICSRFGSQENGVYCIFLNQRCTQLTSDVTDIYDIIAVKAYVNQNKIKCSQVGKSLCHLIDWSTDQKCYYNGLICNNLDYNVISNFKILVDEPSILNEFGCLGAETYGDDYDDESVKYLEYDEPNKRCKENKDTKSYSSCEDVIGNRNICLQFTPNLYCKWNPLQLKCTTMSYDEFKEINTCNYNQNIKACIENNNVACYFSSYRNQCLSAPVDKGCSWFDNQGYVNQKACQSITADGQRCKFNQSNKTNFTDYKCVVATDSLSTCDVKGANSIQCYSNYNGDCRWDSSTNTCYPHNTNVTELGCNDNLNYNLCIKVTKEPCYFDNQKLKCIKLIKFIKPSNANLNQLACLQLQDSAYYFQNNQCLSPSQQFYACGAYSFNINACLLNTKGNQCYYDTNESDYTKRCKPFTDIITQCSSKYQINVEVCTQIPKPCYFDPTTLLCKSANINQQLGCSDLRNSKFIFNKFSCASISADNQNTDDTFQKQCYVKQYDQQCNFERYCFWENYSCQTYVFTQMQWNLHDYCAHNNKFCSQDNDCGTYTYTYYNSTTKEDKDETADDTCSSYNYKCDYTSSIQFINSCSNTLSKALCLGLNSNNCGFNLDYGGCYPLTGNEKFITVCDDLIYKSSVNNYCQSAGNTVCVLDTSTTIIQSNSNCYTYFGINYACKEQDSNNETYKCSQVYSLFTQNPPQSACKNASDNCRFDKYNKICTYQNTQCNQCDSSFSKTLCESCGCNYAKKGYCEQIDSPIKLTSNDYQENYFACLIVNKLNQAQDQQLLCAEAEQACYYNNGQCYDATQMICASILNYIMSSMACTRCLGLSVQYNDEQQICEEIDTSDTCENLNQQACLLIPTIPCKWQYYECSKVTQYDSTDCSIYSSSACLNVNNLCWVNPTTQYCTPFQPEIAECQYLYTKKLCLLSNYQSCIWINSSCQQEISNNCENANKYGCLNMQNLMCGWSESNNTCIAIKLNSNTNQTSCTPNFDSTVKDTTATLFNSIVCSNIKTNNIPCFRDKYYKCRQVQVSDILTCDSNGVNEYACLHNTSNQCKYLNNTCQQETSKQIGCVNNLNLYACINQNAYCQFTQYCNTLQIQTESDISNTQDTFQYSFSSCTALDSTTQYSFIYNQMSNRCSDISTREPFVTSCSTIGINKQACLQKTIIFCQYKDQQCSQVARKAITNITTCDSTLNWYACISLSSQCKFVNSICVPITNEDTCISLQASAAIVNYKICSSRTDVACSLNIANNTCQKVTSSQLCGVSGLNKIGCLFNTKGSLCIFTNGKCLSNYDSNYTCNDLINEDKCLQVKTQGQYCYFDSINGCQKIDQQINDLTICGKLKMKTNSITCSISTDQACFLDIEQTKQCIPYDSKSTINNNWSNSSSFNKQTCAIYEFENIATLWKKEQCIELTKELQSSVGCTDIVNSYGCVSIQTTDQLCQYINQACITVSLDYVYYSNILCNQIKYINKYQICEITDSINPCKYDYGSFSCVQTSIISEGTKQSQISISGYNSAACKCSNCYFIDKCYIYEDNGIFCDSSTVEQCQSIIGQPCQMKNGICQSLTKLELQQIECAQAINQIACQQIQTSKQYCQFINSCQYKDPYTNKNKKCESQGFVNKQEICEQTTDINCKFNSETKQCMQATDTDYNCIRGLNELACNNLTNTSLMCKFYYYCYGPNYNIVNCDTSITNDCCNNATNIDSCLLQGQYKCIWNSITQQCSSYIETNQLCNNIKYSSKQVCTSHSINDKICILDIFTFQCTNIMPTSCDQVQSQEQCININILPCIWNNSLDRCQYQPINSYQKCEDIDLIGNQLACTQIQQIGQKCQFQNNRCIAYEENSNIKNCINNININACVQQIINDCVFTKVIKQIQETQYSDSIEIELGYCIAFEDYENTDCLDTLSFTSCMKIAKVGTYCQWKNNKCQSIQIQNNLLYTIDSFSLVNSNICGIINNEIAVQYDQHTNTCIKVSDITQLNCQSQGLNQISCLQISTEICLWNSLYHYCYPI